MHSPWIRACLFTAFSANFLHRNGPTGKDGHLVTQMLEMGCLCLSSWLLPVLQAYAPTSEQRVSNANVMLTVISQEVEGGLSPRSHEAGCVGSAPGFSHGCMWEHYSSGDSCPMFPFLFYSHQPLNTI